MKKVLGIGIILLLMLVGCSNDDTQASNESSEKETGSDKEQQSKTNDDPYNHFDDVSWEDDHRGLKSEITKVVTSNDADGNGNHLVGIKLKVDNTTDEEFSYRPAYGTLVLSTGEQVKMAADYEPTEINGYIHEGVEMESNRNFLVESDVDEIDWIKFIWDAGQTDDNGVHEDKKEYQVKLELND